jgi:hypothetical protein
MGLSPVRHNYVERYYDWHGAVAKYGLHLPFWHEPRKFDARKVFRFAKDGPLAPQESIWRHRRLHLDCQSAVSREP